MQTFTVLQQQVKVLQLNKFCQSFMLLRMLLGLKVWSGQIL